jgi:glycolate oxidase FAD binding subunit
MDHTLDEFAAAVGTVDPVSVEGSGSRGGAVEATSVVRAPAGIVRVDAAEMVLECGAGTTMDEVHGALAEVGQTVSIPGGGTIGGALAAGVSDITRLAHGPMRDVLLQTHFVAASGKVTKAGGPTVKNVSGFDLCRLLVGSWGTLGFFGDVLVRTRPLPRSSCWFALDGDPFELLATLYRPVAILWDGATTWVRLDGDPHDIETTATGAGLRAADGPPPLPGPHRWSVPPAELGDLRSVSPGSFVAEVGVGIVHRDVPPPARATPPEIRALHDRIKQQFDPSGRLNPGLDPLSAVTSR